MRHTLLAAASALALALSAGSALAWGGPHVQANDNSVAFAALGGVAASSGSTALSDGAILLRNSDPSYTDNSTNTFTKIEVVSKNDLDAHFGGTGITVGGSWDAANIHQYGNAFQNFAGVNTMTQSTAPYNNNQAATSIAAYAPVNFGSGTASQ